MGSNRRTSQDEITLSMAMTDFLPVLLFCTGGILAFAHLHNAFFLIGVWVCTFAGVCKASWKLVLALKERDQKILPKLFHIFMPLGFGIILLTIPFSMHSWGALVKELFRMPSLIFTLIGCGGMVLMGVFAKVLDGKKANANWIEQLTNTAAQLCFVIALLVA